MIWVCCSHIFKGRVHNSKDKKAVRGHIVSGYQCPPFTPRLLAGNLEFFPIKISCILYSSHLQMCSFGQRHEFKKDWVGNHILPFLVAYFTIHKIKDELLQTFSSFVFVDLIGKDLKMQSHSPFKDLPFCGCYSSVCCTWSPMFGLGGVFLFHFIWFI